MSLERGLLAVSAAFVLLAGVGCLAAPGLFAQQAGLHPDPSALTEIRAFYGGLQLGIGLFLLRSLRTPSRTSEGLSLVGLAVGGAGLARGFGILFDHAATPHHLTNLGIELVTVVLVVIALLRARRRAAGAAA